MSELIDKVLRSIDTEHLLYCAYHGTGLIIYKFQLSTLPFEADTATQTNWTRVMRMI